jgi:hypothetical protein
MPRVRFAYPGHALQQPQHAHGPEEGTEKETGQDDEGKKAEKRDKKATKGFAPILGFAKITACENARFAAGVLLWR